MIGFCLDSSGRHGCTTVRRSAVAIFNREGQFDLGAQTECARPPDLEQVLDRYFGNVCELDLIFNFHKASRACAVAASTEVPGPESW